MPTLSHSMPIKMRGDVTDDRWRWRLVFLASLVLHLAVVAFLMLGLPEALPQPQDEEAISVELVSSPPPPEPPKSAKSEPYPVLQPVIQFGEKDAGPKLSPEGDSANEAAASPTAPRDPDERDHAQPHPVTTVKARGEAPQSGAGEAPAPMPQDEAKAQKAATLRKAKTLFSQRATGDSLATIALRSVPRDVRIARLCATELKEQLLHARPSYFAEIVPFERLKEGMVVENLSVAFRANWEWYDLSYRCEIDAEATKVVSFAFDIGKPLTAEEWRRRGLPQ
jgi:Domain of Unknown Function (DUF930)